MIDLLKAILQNSPADAWEITESTTNGWEFYFIRHELDQNRVKQVTHANVTVYRAMEDGKLLGSASGEIPVTLTREETEARIRELLTAATYVRNPFFRLNPPSPASSEKDTPVDVAAISSSFMRALRQVPESADADINSYEIFVNDVTTRYCNSEGVNVTYRTPKSMAEVVVNARKENHEVELYRLYLSGTCDADSLCQDVVDTLAYGKDRLVVTDTPELGKADVVFSTQDACAIYEWYIDRMSTALRFAGISDWEIGKAITDTAVQDKVTVQAVRTLPNSSRNTPYDREGAPIRDLLIMENNVPMHYHGQRQFSQYLGIQDAFIASNFIISGGSEDEESIRSGEFLEIVEFSDFQVSAFNGDIAGEIRLAYWHHDGQVTPVSGGSVSGTMADFIQNLRMSKTSRQYDHLKVPALTRLHNVHITGVAKA